ncbi:MAG: hypothetical protein PHX30_04440 [Candidatus Pacebacteria bacterium]|nr:hypothetical protein [Candidatus Paceibacterota bacterium]
MVAKVPLGAGMSSSEDPSVGKLHLFFEDMDPGKFGDYDGSVIFPEWFTFCVLRKRTLLEITRVVENTGGVVLPMFWNRFNQVDKNTRGIEVKKIGPIIHIN